MRSPGPAPSGLVWSKKLRAAMSSECFWAASRSRELAVTGPQPAVARSLLTRAMTSSTVPLGAGGAAGVAEWRWAGRAGSGDLGGVLELGLFDGEAEAD